MTYEISANAFLVMIILVGTWGAVLGYVLAHTGRRRPAPMAATINVGSPNEIRIEGYNLPDTLKIIESLYRLPDVPRDAA